MNDRVTLKDLRQKIDALEIEILRALEARVDHGEWQMSEKAFSNLRTKLSAMKEMYNDQRDYIFSQMVEEWEQRRIDNSQGL